MKPWERNWGTPATSAPAAAAPPLPTLGQQMQAYQQQTGQVPSLGAIRAANQERAAEAKADDEFNKPVHGKGKGYSLAPGLSIGASQAGLWGLIKVDPDRLLPYVATQGRHLLSSIGSSLGISGTAEADTAPPLPTIRQQIEEANRRSGGAR